MNQLLLMPSPYSESDTVSLYPCVSIIMPFEPKMKSKRELSSSLNKAAIKVEDELLEKFQIEMAMLVIEKLKIIIKDLSYSTHKKSVAIYVSAVFEKVLYLNMEVKERIMIEDSFAIRDIIKSKKEVKEYLVLVFGEEETKIYLDNTMEMQQVFSNRSGYRRNIDELIFNKGYLQHIDVTLNIILQSFKFPLFVLGDKKVIHQFKNITRHASSIIDYAEHNGENISPGKLRKTISPLIHNWPCVKRESLKHQLTHACGEKKVVSGIEEVFSEAMHRHGRLLLVEKNYKYPSGYGSDQELIDSAIHPYSSFSYIKDAVDDIIEKVLEENGDVEFVDEELLKDYDHIALIL
ncbi:MAG: hypothetical protein ABIO76_10025 [Ginsengibacter sp.]